MNIERILSAMEEFKNSDMQVTTWPKCVIVHNDHSSVMVKLSPTVDKVDALCEAIERLKFAEKGVAIRSSDNSEITQSDKP